MSYNTANGSLKIQQMLTNRMNKPVHKRFSELGFVKGSFVPKVAATEAMFFKQISLKEIQIYSKIGLDIYIYLLFIQNTIICVTGVFLVVLILRTTSFYVLDALDSQTVV